MSTSAALVLAAGRGVRMKSVLPKVLHRVCGAQMLRLVVDSTLEAGSGPTTVVVGPKADEIKEALGDRVTYVEQAEPLGSGHAVLQARTRLGGAENITVRNGDVPLVRPETLRLVMHRHLESRPCITLLTAIVRNPDGLGRIVRGEDGKIDAVVEEADADEGTFAIKEVNAGVYCFSSAWLWPALERLTPSASGETYLTDLVELASREGMGIESVDVEDTDETLGVNTRVQLAEVEAAMRSRIRNRWMLSGVTMPDPASVYIDIDAKLGADTMVLPNTHITGASRIGAGCEIGPNTIIDGSDVADHCRVFASVVEGSRLEDRVEVGPFSHIRPGSRLESGVRIGNFGEVKGSHLGPGTKSPHFSYIGDAEIGASVNVGAGTVTCNYDGVRKHRTRIEDGAHIGSSSMLVAPVTIGARSATGAGAVVTRDVPPDSLAVGVPAKSRPKKPPMGRAGQ